VLLFDDLGTIAKHPFHPSYHCRRDDSVDARASRYHLGFRDRSAGLDTFAMGDAHRLWRSGGSVSEPERADELIERTAAAVADATGSWISRTPRACC
jgi:hypothetical protein